MTDMNLQHPELIPLLLIVEPKLKENEWIEVKGLMSRSLRCNDMKNEAEMMNQQKDEACVCIIERTNPLDQPNICIAQGTCWSILESYAQADNNDTTSSNDRSKLSTNLPSISNQDDEDSDESSSPGSHSGPKRQRFEDRLKMALEHGDTTDDEASKNNSKVSMTSPPKVQEQSFETMMQKRKLMLEEEEFVPKVLRETSCSDHDDDKDSCNNSFAGDSVYSFESLIVPYEMESAYEDLQISLVKPLHMDENCQLRSLAITDELKRMSLSDAYLDKALHLDKTTNFREIAQKSLRRYQSDLGRSSYGQKFRRRKNSNKGSKEDDVKLPVWIVTHSEEVDSKRFLVEWLAASVSDVPLVVYQASNGSICTDVVAAICSWIEEQSWTTQELLNALIQGGSSF